MGWLDLKEKLANAAEVVAVAGVGLEAEEACAMLESNTAPGCDTWLPRNSLDMVVRSLGLIVESAEATTEGLPDEGGNDWGGVPAVIEPALDEETAAEFSSSFISIDTSRGDLLATSLLLGGFHGVLSGMLVGAEVVTGRSSVGSELGWVTILGAKVDGCKTNQ